MNLHSGADTYRKIFLVTTIPFGLFVGLWTGWTGGPWHGLIAGIGGGLFYGCFMSLTIGTLQQLLTKQLKPDRRENIMGVHQVQVVLLEQSFDQALCSCQTSLLALKKCEITNQNNELGILHAKTGMTWKSFGERIMLTVSPAGDATCQVTISSKPALRTTLLDYGKNAENVRAIIESLRTQAPVSVPQIVSTSATEPPLALRDGAEVIEADTTIKLKQEERETL